MSTLWKKIVCPVDFSPTAGAAADTAATLGAALGAHVTLLHVVPAAAWVLPDGVIPVPPESYDRYMREVEQRLGEWRDGRARAGLTMDIATVMGDAAGQIVAFARERGCDVVVIGTHGRTGLAHALLGSIAEKVVRTCEVPVLTVKGGSR